MGGPLPAPSARVELYGLCAQRYAVRWRQQLLSCPLFLYAISHALVKSMRGKPMTLGLCGPLGRGADIRVHK
jgi:hypothetical protein